MIKKLLGIFLLIFVTVFCVEAKLKDTEIIVSVDAAAPEKFAARELKLWLKKLSGHDLPLLIEASNEKVSRIFIGRCFAEDKFATDIGALTDVRYSDGYAVRKSGDDIYIFGAIPKGTLNGVYVFIEKNSDLIWLRPDFELGTIYTVRPDMQITWFSGIEKPVFTKRKWGINSAVRLSPIRHMLWLARTRAFYSEQKHFLHWASLYDDLGVLEYFGGGHNFNLYLSRDKYWDTHPEFYSLIDGHRLKMGTQLCFTNDEMIQTLLMEMRAMVEPYGKLEVISLMLHDHGTYCQCEQCQAPIKLPDGSILTHEDPAFNSTQHMIFINKVAREVAKIRPETDLSCFAYTFATIPPKVRPEPNVRILYCVIKDYKHPIESSVNNAKTPWLEWTKRWPEISEKVVLREYYGLGGEFPNQMEAIVAQDLKLCKAIGINDFAAEITADHSKVGSQNFKTYIAWDMSSIVFWGITRLYWNPDQDVEAIRADYFNRTYHEAAPTMRKLYDLMREKWLNDPRRSDWNAIDTLYSCIIKAGAEQTCRALLKQALGEALHPISKKLITRIEWNFDEMCQKAKQLHSTPTVEVPYSAEVDWKLAGVIENLTVENTVEENPSEATQVQLLHDNQNLYIRMLFSGDPPVILPTAEERADSTREFIPKGEFADIFISRQNVKIFAYHFVFDALGKTYDADGMRHKWKTNWTVKTRMLSDGSWEALVTIPFSSVNFDFAKGNMMYALFARDVPHKDGSREISTWGGRPLFKMDCQLIINQNEGSLL